LFEHTGHSNDEFLQGFGFPAANSDPMGKKNLYSQSGMSEDLQVIKLPHSSYHKISSVENI
jgi:hypothetical protein